MEMWIFKRTTWKIRETIGKRTRRKGRYEKRRTFRDCEFFTRIIRLREDPAIRRKGGQIFFSSRRHSWQTKRFRSKGKTVKLYPDLYLYHCPYVYHIHLSTFVDVEKAKQKEYIVNVLFIFLSPS